MNSKDKAFLEKFCVKESSNLIGLENLGTAGFSITAVLGWYSPCQSKSDQIFTHQSLSPPPLPHTHTKLSLTPPYYYLKWEIKV